VRIPISNIKEESVVVNESELRMSQKMKERRVVNIKKNEYKEVVKGRYVGIYVGEEKEEKEDKNLRLKGSYMYKMEKLIKIYKEGSVIGEREESNQEERIGSK
jgi:hypothetical protein